MAPLVSRSPGVPGHDVSHFVPHHRGESTFVLTDLEKPGMNPDFSPGKSKGIWCRIFKNHKLPLGIWYRHHLRKSLTYLLNLRIIGRVGRDLESALHLLELGYPHGGFFVGLQNVDLLTSRIGNGTAGNHHDQGDEQKRREDGGKNLSHFATL